MKRMGKIAAALIAACTLFSGASVAVADQAAPSTNTDQQATPTATSQDVPGDASVSNVKVSDIGAHTANVSFNWSLGTIPVDAVKNVCFMAYVSRITDVTRIKDFGNNAWGLGWDFDPQCEGGTADDQLTQADYNNIYGFKNNQDMLTDDNGVVYAKASYQSFTRYNNDSWNGKTSGTFNLPVIGLEPETTYGTNREYPAYTDGAVDELARHLPLGVRTPVDDRQFYVGLVIYLKDGYTFLGYFDHVNFASNMSEVTDLTTTAEPASKPTAPDLTEQNKGSVTVPDGTVKAGSVARIYVNKLAQECAAKVDAGEDCFWYSYIYSDPVRLTGPDGSPFVTIKKDKDGKYYFDAFIPANYSGVHKIALQDEKGNIQGWTDVTVGEQTPTPAPADKTALNKAITAADKLVKTDYTEASWTLFAKALEAAKTVAGKADAKQAEVDAAAKALVNTQTALKKAEKTPSKDEHEADTDTTKPDTDKKPEQNPAKTDTKKQTLPKSGASIIAVIAVMAALATTAGAACVVRRRRA
ncbi:glycosyl hydrolase family 25 [Bifidobacterium hapali]|uniref:Glycosyl hydrolase family 25 n=1 Tax=Bifidobacterium hapali TaxID=1630172 RepID=A0A261FSH4_9BIFI|nr:FIVAR domain-containing protein [Bifidobacterium hapali]OZG62144.1 glycosyl hydrolase family 25 [Bifidobacterium hapali]